MLIANISQSRIELISRPYCPRAKLCECNRLLSPSGIFENIWMCEKKDVLTLTGLKRVIICETLFEARNLFINEYNDSFINVVIFIEKYYVKPFI